MATIEPSFTKIHISTTAQEVLIRVGGLDSWDPLMKGIVTFSGNP